MHKFKLAELRFGHYIRSTGLHSNQLTLAFALSSESLQPEANAIFITGITVAYII